MFSLPWSSLDTFGFSAKYRATDLKKLIDDNGNDQGCGGEADLEIQQNGTLLNPLFNLNAEKEKTDNPTGFSMEDRAFNDFARDAPTAPPERNQEGDLLSL